jgi:extradiol dioxygenase family protein
LASTPPFHLAIPVSDLDIAEAFYCGLLGCSKGRTASRWIDLNFFGHQVTLHLSDGPAEKVQTNPVDGAAVPARHFGVVLSMPAWQELADHLQQQNQEFLISPGIRFPGKVGEQATMFLYDPSGNALEFKSFADPAQLFATSESSVNNDIAS